MSKEELAAFKVEMLEWDEKYEQHCARDMEVAGDAWKGVAEATKVMSNMVRRSRSCSTAVLACSRRADVVARANNRVQAEQLGNKFSVAIIGFVVTTLADPRAVAMNRGYASSPRVRHFMDLKQLDMQNLMGDLTLLFG